MGLGHLLEVTLLVTVVKVGSKVAAQPRSLGSHRCAACLLGSPCLVNLAFSPTTRRLTQDLARQWPVHAGAIGWGLNPRAPFPEPCSLDRVIHPLCEMGGNYRTDFIGCCRW